EVPLPILTGLLETAVLVGEIEMTRILEHRLSGVASMLANPHLTCIARHLGAAAGLLGNKEKAKEYYQQALEVCAKIRHRPEAALTHLQLAELLLEEAGEAAALKGGRAASYLHKEAMQHLDFAI